MYRIASLLIHIGVPAAAALTLVSVLVMERVDIDYDLQVIAPTTVRPGSSLPIRVHLLGHLRRVEGPELVVKKVYSDLITDTGQRVVRVHLRPSFGNTLDGVLEMPFDLEGSATLRTVAQLDTDQIGVDIQLSIRRNALPMQTYRRELEPLRQFSAGEVIHHVPVDPPCELDVRVVGGVCVPEQRCDLLVWVGCQHTSVEVARSSAVTPVGSSKVPIESITTITVVIHGPEANLHLFVRNGATLLAERAIRLPIALASSSLRLQEIVVNRAMSPVFRLEDKQEDAGCIVDVYHHNHWLFTHGFEDCLSDIRLPFRPSRPGIWRIQARRDPFSSDSASVRHFYVRGSQESNQAVLGAIVEHLLHRDRFAARVLMQSQDSEISEFNQKVAFLLAGEDADLVPQPKPTTSLEKTRALLLRQRRRTREFSLLFLSLAGLTLGFLVARRGFRAASKARKIMADAGDTKAYTYRKNLQMTLTILAAVTAILLTFVAIAIYIIARDSGV